MADRKITDNISSTPSNGDEPLYEIVDGERIELWISVYSCMIASRLAIEFSVYDQRKSGEVVAQALFDLGLPKERKRRPDVAFVKHNRWPKGKIPPHNLDAWHVVPNLVVEVVSHSDLADELMGKVDEYFRAGVESVWVVYPCSKLVYRFASLSKIAAFRCGDTLTDDKILPGYQLPLNNIFLK